MELPLPLNHVFVDFENVQTIDPNVFGNKGISFLLLLGPHKKKFDVSLVEQLMAHAASVELVRLAASGRNALDFTLAYYVGRAVATNPSGFFHIISKDKGYDPMIEHLRSCHIKVRRHEDFSKLTFGPAFNSEKTPVVQSRSTMPRPASKPVPDELFRKVLERLCKHPNNRPKRRNTLTSHLAGFLKKLPTDPDIASLIEHLRNAGYVVFDEKGVATYHLPTTD